MHVELHPRFADTAAGREARELTSACVHCGFCLTSCPTYVDSRDERDSPRGRIYLVKHFLETGEGSAQTRLHLDRCLTCRNCETACPSGMRYGELLDIGRGLVEEETPRPARTRALRALMRAVLARPRLFGFILTMGRILRPGLPRAWQAILPSRQSPAAAPDTSHSRRMLVLEGCVQRAATPGTNAAARRVFDRLGISLIDAPGAGCCGALDHHLAGQDQALDRIRRNIDAWWPYIEEGAEAIVSSASGCGALLIDYGRLLADDPAYAHKAMRVSEMTRDVGQILLAENLDQLGKNTSGASVAIHTPCTLEHALGQADLVHRVLRHTGFKIVDTGKILCCGSAGTYSMLQRETSERLRETALGTLAKDQPDIIATANVGCRLHMQAGTDIPVVHWIELLDRE